MNTQKGFTLVEGLLIVIVVGIIGFSGFYVWNQQQDDETEQTETVQQEQEKVTTSQEEDDTSIPEGSVRYSNPDLGITFVYPESWGAVTEKEFSGGELDNYFEFTPNLEYFGLGGFEKGYEFPPRGGSLMDYGGFIEENGKYYDRHPGNGTRQNEMKGYLITNNGNCIYNTNVIFFESQAYHATCNLKSETQYGFNFGIYDLNGSNMVDIPPVNESDFIQTVESVVIN